MTAAFATAGGHAVTITHPTPAPVPPARDAAIADAILRAAGAAATGEA